MKLTKAFISAGETGPEVTTAGPVWINPMGVNSIESSESRGLTWVRMDDGTGYLVAEPATVVARRAARALRN